MSVNVDRRVVVQPVRPRSNRCSSARWSAASRLALPSPRASWGWLQSRPRQTCAGIKSILQSSRLLGLLRPRLIEEFNSVMTGSFSERDEIGLRPADEMIRDHIRLGAKDRYLEEAPVRRPLQECCIKGRQSSRFHPRYLIAARDSSLLVASSDSSSGPGRLMTMLLSVPRTICMAIRMFFCHPSSS